MRGVPFVSLRMNEESLFTLFYMDRASCRMNFDVMYFYYYNVISRLKFNQINYILFSNSAVRPAYNACNSNKLGNTTNLLRVSIFSFLFCCFLSKLVNISTFLVLLQCLHEQNLQVRETSNEYFYRSE